MPVRSVLKYVVLPTGILSLAAAVGCGTGGGNPTFNNTENFSNASLKGSYAYQIHGGDSALDPYREIGVFTADGAGNITSGSDDAQISGISLTSPASVTGSYHIAADGTGTITMSSALNSTINLGVTMVSNSKLYLIEADNANSTLVPLDGAGTAELQDPSALGTTPAGSFVFRIHDEISGPSLPPASMVGMFTAPGNGVNGAMDTNAGGTFSSPNITWSFGAPDASGRGSGHFVNASTSATVNFTYYIVSGSKVNLLMSDSGVIGSGAAEMQTGAVASGLAGNYAFGSSGDNNNFALGLYGTVATVGQFTASNGTISGVQDSLVDTNQSSNASIAGCYTAAANGRVAVTTSTGGVCSNSVSQVFWMVNPNRAFFLDLQSQIFDDGTADLQTVASFTSSTMKGQYALLMSGTDFSPLQVNLNPQLLARVGAVKLDGVGAVSVNELANASDPNVGGVNAPGILSGAYAVSPNGRITGGAANGGGGFDFVMYAVSGSQAYTLQGDAGTVTSGTLERQP